jgi:hypothetical protein
VVKTAQIHPSEWDSQIDGVLLALLLATAHFEIGDLPRNFTLRIYAQNCFEL